MTREGDQPLVAALQHESDAGAIDANLDRMFAVLDEAVDQGVDLAVLPECGVQGYGYDDEEAVRRDAVTLDDPLMVRVREEISRRGLHAVVGFIERAGDELYNATALVAPTGAILGTHRKIHRPSLGVDRFVAPGDRAPSAFDTAVGRVGLLICADMVFPEATRIAALKGADIIAISACVPSPLTMYSDALIRVRGYENCTYVVYCDMAGTDGAWRYEGRSQIVNPSGQVLAEAPREGAHVIVAAVDHEQARNKLRIREPGGGIPHAYEFDFFAQRRPELYDELTSADVRAADR
jgi:predicted amidohydrolase